jgi:hypothetical protein
MSRYTNQIEARAAHMRDLAQSFAKLMEQDDALGKLIEEAIESDDDEDKELACTAVMEFQASAAQIIGCLAIVVCGIDNSSATMYLGGLAGAMVETEMEHDPLVLLRGLLGGR